MPNDIKISTADRGVRSAKLHLLENHDFPARDDSTLEIVSNDRQRAKRAMKLSSLTTRPIWTRS